MVREFVFSGFGGQGVLTAGMLLANTGAINDMEVSWIPSYGSEMRGGTANCTVKLGDEEIPSPFAKHLDVLVAMNEPSLIKFAPLVKRDGGVIVVNSSIVERVPDGPGVKVIKAPVNELAAKAGSERSANICVLGVVAAVSGVFSREKLIEGIRAYFAKGGKNNDANIAAFNAGYDFAGKDAR